MAIEMTSAVDEFWQARKRGEYFPAAYEGRLSLDEAYRIQLALIDRRVAAGENHMVGRSGSPRRPSRSSLVSMSQCLAASSSRSLAATSCRPT